MKNVPDLLALAEAQDGPALACISVSLPGVDVGLERTLKEQGLPYLLFGAPMTGAAWAAAVTLWPFSAFQIAQELLAIPVVPPTAPVSRARRRDTPPPT